MKVSNEKKLGWLSFACASFSVLLVLIFFYPKPFVRLIETILSFILGYRVLLL